MIGGDSLKIIMISGKAESGKDFIAQKVKKYLEQRNHSVLTIHFGDKLKFICEKYFNWDGKKDEKGRTLLQTVGTNKIRSLDKDYFVNDVLGILKLYNNNWDYVLIPDLRFINEYKLINNEFKTTTIRKSRNKISSLTELQKNNQSEIEMDNFNFDYYIDEYEENKFNEIMEEILNG